MSFKLIGQNIIPFWLSSDKSVRADSESLKSFWKVGMATNSGAGSSLLTWTISLAFHFNPGFLSPEVHNYVYNDLAHYCIDLVLTIVAL